MSRALVSFKACPFLAFVCRTCSGTPTPFTAPVRLRAGCATTQVCTTWLFYQALFVLIIFISSFLPTLPHFCAFLPKKECLTEGFTHQRPWSNTIPCHRCRMEFELMRFHRIKHASYFVFHPSSTLQQTLLTIMKNMPLRP